MADDKKWINKTTDDVYWQDTERRWWMRVMTPTTEEVVLIHDVLIVPVNAPTREEIESTAICATTDERYWRTPDGKWWWEEYDDQMVEVSQDTVDGHTDGHNGVGIMVFKSD